MGPHPRRPADIYARIRHTIDKRPERDVRALTAAVIEDLRREPDPLSVLAPLVRHAVTAAYYAGHFGTPAQLLARDIVRDHPEPAKQRRVAGVLAEKLAGVACRALRLPGGREDAVVEAIVIEEDWLHELAGALLEATGASSLAQLADA